MNEHLRQVLGLPIKTPLEYWIKYWGYYIRQLEDKKEISIGLTGPMSQGQVVDIFDFVLTK